MSKYSLFWSVLHDPRTFKNDSSNTGGGGDDDNNSNSVHGNATVIPTGATLKTGTVLNSADDPVVFTEDSSGNVVGQNQSAIDDDNNATSVTVESGDTLSEIAESLDTSVGELMDANPGITNPNEIVVGQTINTTGVQTGVDTYEGMDDQFFPDVGVPGIDTSYADKLAAAGEDDTSALDEIAASDTTGIDVYEPTSDTVTAVTDYYTEGAGSDGATQDVDYTETSSGEDFEVAAAADDSDISGGTNYTTYFGQTVEVRELPSGTKYYVDLEGKYVALAPEEDVTVDTFSDSEVVVPAGDQTKYDDTILETGTGGISGIRTGDAMTPQLAAELGIGYFEGDTIQSSDLIKLSNLGFDVSQADLTKAKAEVPLDVDVTVSTGAGTGTVDQGPVEGTMAGGFGEDLGNYAGVEGGGEPGDAGASYAEIMGTDQMGGTDLDAVDTSGMTTIEDAIAELKRRVNEGIYTADVSVNELTGTLALLEGRELTDDEIAAFMPDYQFVKPDPGTQILGEASGALGQEQLGALSLAIADGMSKLGIDYDIETLDTLGQNLAAYGLGQIESGQAGQDVAFEKLKQFDPAASEAFNQPIIDPDTGEFNATALYTKGIYSAAPTIAGLSGLLVGLIPGAVTGAVMTAAELGSESFNKAYEGALAQGLSEEDALGLARTANATAAALGAPIGAVSNMLLGSLSSGIGTGSVANRIASAGATMLAGAVDEGLVEQSTIASVVDTQLGNEGNIYTTPNGEAFSWNVSMDEGILGALTGGLVSLSAYTAAKAAGATDAQIANAVENTPPGQTVDLTNTVFDASSEVTPFTTASEILQSGDNVTIGTDADGNITLVNNDTGESSVLTGSEVIAGSALTGSETTVGGLQAVEDSTIGGQGANVTIDAVGNNLVVTNNDTGFSAVVGVKDNVNIVDVTSAVQNNDATAVQTSGASVNTTGTGGITSIAGASAATGAVGANAATAATANIGTTTTTAGNTDVTTVGDVTVTTTVDAAGNTIVSTTNNTTGATTADIISAGTTGVVTNGTVDVAVDATTSNVTTTAVDTATDVATDAVTDVTSDVVTDAVTNTVVDTVVSDDDDFTATSDVVTTPTDEFTPDDGGDDDPLGETEPGYTSGIAGLGGGVRPVVAPYYQPQQAGQYSFYVPQPGVDQTPAQPVFTQPTSYLAPTAQPQYGYGYIAPNTDIEYLRRLAEIQGTGAEKLPSEDLMDGS